MAYKTKLVLTDCLHSINDVRVRESVNERGQKSYQIEVEITPHSGYFLALLKLVHEDEIGEEITMSSKGVKVTSKNLLALGG